MTILDNAYKSGTAVMKKGSVNVSSTIAEALS